jgi:mRNA-degrading endonuclease RelE of RelBE toxin-antitoxin system
MKIIIHKKAQKYINKLPKNLETKVVSAINKLPQGDIKIIVGGVDEYRLRVGGLRVLFIMTDDTIRITNIKPHGDAY